MSVDGALKALFPRRFKKSLKGLLGITAIEQRMNDLEALVFESKDQTWERARTRWRHASPTENLTWGIALAGQPFIDKAEAYEAFGPQRSILEIGPGYGRLLNATLERQYPFRKYTGIDLSAENVAYLGRRFPDERIRFIEGDAELAQFDDTFDTILSSLTLKHFFPTCERALANLTRSMRPGGRLIFDLIEGEKTVFESDMVTYVRWYTKDEILSMLDRIGLVHVAFDQVDHAPGYSRLLVVAAKPDHAASAPTA